MEEKTLTERIEEILTPTGRILRGPEMQRILVVPGHRAAALADATAMIDLADLEKRVLTGIQDVLDIETDPNVMLVRDKDKRYYPVPAAGNRRERREEAARLARQRKKRR